MEDFFSNLAMPTLDDSDKSKLENVITTSEINEAIKKLKSGKSPGTDGFPIEFFKMFASKLVPLLLKLFREVLDKKALPTTMTQAAITLLLKKIKRSTAM